MMRGKIFARMLCLGLAANAANAPATAHAAPNIATDSAVFVERNGSHRSRLLEPATVVNRGERVITIVRWYKLGGDGAFTITNPLPHDISYQKSSHENEQVSVDGGRSWGHLGKLRIGSRLASPEDVTHVRWRIPAPVAASGTGQIAYSGIVR